MILLNRPFKFRTGREAFRFNQYEKPVLRYAYEVGVEIRHDPSEPKGFVVVTAYPRNEEPVPRKSIKPPKAFFDFAERMFQDSDADFGFHPAAGTRLFLARARVLAEKEGRKLYRNPVNRSDTPKPKDFL